MNIPLHPMLVHFPIVLTALMPVLLIAFLIAERKMWATEKIWFLALGLSLLTPLSTFLAMRAGENDEELVEKVVRENLIEVHAEWGEWVLWMGIAVFICLLASMIFKKIKILKVLPILISLAAIFPVVQAGHSGGELVYKYNAAQVHSQKVDVVTPSSPSTNEKED